MKLGKQDPTKDLDDDTRDEIEGAVKEILERRQKQGEIERLKLRIAEIENGNGHKVKPEPKPQEAPAQEPKAPKLGFSLPKLKPSKPPAEPVIYNKVSEETINVHATKIMPKSDKLQFIEPKAIELPAKAMPRVKLIVEHMTRPINKKSIDPRVLIGAGVCAVIAVIAISILYSQVIEPADKAQKAYDLEVLRHGGNATGIPKPAGGGGLFHFEPINPFAPPPGTKSQAGGTSGSTAKALAPLAVVPAEAYSPPFSTITPLNFTVTPPPVPEVNPGIIVRTISTVNATEDQSEDDLN